MADFASKTLSSWAELESKTPNYKTDWYYRGQVADWDLQNSLERACAQAGIAREDVPSIEKQLIRMSRRRYDGPNKYYVLSDILYCMSLMQHHGAPTALMDLTLSPYVAIFFAIQAPVDMSKKLLVVWCFNRHWLNSRFKIVTGHAGKNTIDVSNDISMAESNN